MDKKCPICKQVKPDSEFYNNRARNGGKEWCCKPCFREKRHKAYIKNRPEGIRKAREWQVKNPEKLMEYRNKFRRDRPMAHRYYNIKSDNKDKVKMTSQEFNDWYENEPKECFYCSIPLDMLEHNNKYINHRGSHNLFTIDRKKSGGDYSLENIVLACPLCNLVKTNFFSVDTMRELAQTYIKPRWQQSAGIDPTDFIGDVRKREKERILAIVKEYGLDNVSVRDDMLEKQALGWQALTEE